MGVPWDESRRKKLPSPHILTQPKRLHYKAAYFL